MLHFLHKYAVLTSSKVEGLGYKDLLYVDRGCTKCSKLKGKYV